METSDCACEPLNGDSVLHMRARKNNDRDIQHALDTIPVDILNNRRETPLMVAAQFGAFKIAKRFLTKKPNVNKQDIDGQTALHHAVLGQSHKVINLLRHNNADCSILNDDGKTAIHLATEANASDLLSGLTKRLDEEIIDTVNRDGETALLSAAKLCQIKALRQLIASGSNLKFADNTGKTALHYACIVGNPTAVKLLLTHTTVSLRDNYGNTPLAIAVRHSSERAIDVLCRFGANCDVRDIDGNTLIHLACRSNNIYILKHFLTPEVSPANQPVNWLGETPMHIACKKGQLLALDTLIADNQYLDPIDNRQRTPLMLAIEKGHNRLAIALLAAKGPDNSTVNVNTKDACGNTALHYCSLHDNDLIASLLINYNANIHEQNILGFTPYTMLTQFGKLEDSIVYRQVYRKYVNIPTENVQQEYSPEFPQIDFSLDDFI